MLSGLKYSAAHTMHICGNVKDKCCSIADEFKISKLWKERTEVLMTSHIDICLYYLRRIFETFNDIREMDPLDMTTKSINT